MPPAGHQTPPARAGTLRPLPHLPDRRRPVLDQARTRPTGARPMPARAHVPATEDEPAATDRTPRTAFCSVYHVFNLEQTEGLERFHRPAQLHTPARNCRDVVSQVATHAHIEIRHVPADRACYTPRLDRITMPEREQFHDEHSYEQTLLHELAHAPGRGRVSRLRERDLVHRPAARVGPLQGLAPARTERPPADAQISPRALPRDPRARPVAHLVGIPPAGGRPGPPHRVLHAGRPDRHRRTPCNRRWRRSGRGRSRLRADAQHRSRAADQLAVDPCVHPGGSPGRRHPAANGPRRQPATPRRRRHG